MFMRSLLACAVILCAALTLPSAHALDVKLVAFSTSVDASHRSRVAVRFFGPIGKGDFQRMFGQSGTAASGSLLDPSRWAPGSIVYLNSNGGNLAEAIRIGRELRNRGFWTAVQPADSCASACVVLLMGGARRWMDSGSTIVIHTPEIVKGAPADAAARKRILRGLEQQLFSFAGDLGIDKGLVANMFTTPFDRPRRLLDREAALWQLASDFGDPFADFIYTEPVAFPAALTKR
jgi:hypothetical protein